MSTGQYGTETDNDGDNSAEQARSRTSSSGEEHDPRPVWTLGLLPAPELPERIIENIKASLIKRLENQISSEVQWRLEVQVDPLVGADDKGEDILDQATSLKSSSGWRYAVCITDLPLFRGRQLVIAEASQARGVALLSQPALGASPMTRRVEEAIVQLVSELHFGSSEEGRANAQQYHHKDSTHRRRNARELVGRRLSEWIAPIARLNVDDDQHRIDVRFVSKFRPTGDIKLIGGMVRANRPWTIFPAFRRIGVAAFATGAYGMIFTSMWRLADSYEPWRFAAMMLASLIAMTLWIIVDHNLWEPLRHKNAFPNAGLYNLATTFTLGIGVLFYYVTLFILFFLCAWLLVPPAVMGQTLGHEAGWLQFLSLAWLAASMGTIGGALGSGLESDETVRSATYGYRQQARQQHVKALTDSDSQESSNEQGARHQDRS
ncbi:hypothetical protein SAMN05421848_1316 [Kushneria avicenniae]|uniref:Uncharacterized protein n=1 Tax=Kushneria avicenniae TaxID=402385 RepID=A0A1I1J2T8_9GAMM|nr:hypothetical protein [Kushneria avicenniae]SFC42786.1 hypothetical protein SAMN05421848_1316 [Kushneria avicenniae]